MRSAALGLLAACCLLCLSATSAGAEERSVIGRSVEGRPILSIRDGPPDAALHVLVVGAIHGDETAGMAVARQLAGAATPRGVELWVVPTLNPDGVAAHTRGNAHGVDLNRNFGYDWTHLSGGEYSGTHAFSEPESRAARRLIARIRPDLTIWFHQPFGIVDGGGDFAERRFARLIGLPLVALPGRYPGAATRWQNHTFPGITAFVTELPADVGGVLVRRAARAVRALSAELASPGLEGNQLASGGGDLGGAGDH